MEKSTFENEPDRPMLPEGSLKLFYVTVIVLLITTALEYWGWFIARQCSSASYLVVSLLMSISGIVISSIGIHKQFLPLYHKIELVINIFFVINTILLTFMVIASLLGSNHC